MNGITASDTHRPSDPDSVAAQALAHPLVEALAGILDMLDCALMVCDGRGRLLWRNRAAAEELARGTVLQVQADGALNVAGGIGLLALRRAIHAALQHDSRHLVPLRHGENHLMLAVLALRGSFTEGQRVLLMGGRRGPGDGQVLQQLADLHGLTRSEKSVLVGLLQGERIGEMARQRRVAECTVRTQVAALRDKFGVHRVEDVARLASSLPPLADWPARQVSGAA